MNNIPKIVHFYWGKNNPLTFLQYLSVVSFREHNPGWKIKIYYPLYTTKSLFWNTFEQKLDIVSNDYFKELYKHDVETIEIDFDTIGFKNSYPEVIKSDYFRYYILCKEGGIWSDFDILYINSIENINYDNFKVYGDKNNIEFCINYNHYWGNDFMYSVGFIASTPNNKIIKNLTDNCFKCITTNYQSLGNIYVKNLLKSPDELSKNINNVNFLIFPKEFYLPYGVSSELNYIFNETNFNMITENTVGIHWFNGHPTSRQFQNDLEKNTCSTNGTIWNYIKKYQKYII